MPENTNIVVKEGTKDIVSSAFFGCSGLTSITIPNSVKSIGSGAFSECSSLTSVTNLATSPQKIAEDTFYDYDKKVRVLHVLPGCKAAYGVADGWKDFTIVEDATTGIDVVKGTPTISSDKIFSISGQQLNKTKKGVNVINGKKILVK